MLLAFTPTWAIDHQKPSTGQEDFQGGVQHHIFIEILFYATHPKTSL
jgi:hypothetical protein